MKLPPPSVERYRGKSALLVTRRRSDEANRARATHILAKQTERSLHALGAAIPHAIALAARLVDESDGALVAHTTTGTEVLFDRADDDDATLTTRLNSAVHVRLCYSTRAATLSARG